MMFRVDVLVIREKKTGKVVFRVPLVPFIGLIAMVAIAAYVTAKVLLP